MSDSSITVELRAKIDDLEKKLNKAEKDLKDFEKNANDSTSGAGNAFKSLGKVIASAIVLDKVVSLTKAMIDITARFEKYNAVLTNTLGSQAAATATMSQLQDFAAKTPYSVDELTASFVKLANQGFLASRTQLTKLGDLAASTGKSFDQLAEAILDAQQGEYERLKEFGIRAKDNGDSVIFTFKGVQTQVEKTSGAIREYITELGGAEGVSGSMAAISETLSGQLSNLGDSWDAVLVSFGNRTSGVFKTAIDNLNTFLQRVAEANRNMQNAEDVGVKSGFWDRWLEGVKSLFGGGPSNTELIGGQVEADKKDFEDLATQLTANAKSAADFKKAVAGINAEFEKYSSRQAAGSVLYKSLENAKNSAIALVEAQKKIFDQQKSGGGNFGKGKKEKTGFALLSQEITDLEEKLQNSIIAGNTKESDARSPLVLKLNAAKKALEDYKAVADTITSGLSAMNPDYGQPINAPITGTNVPFGGADAGMSGLKKWQDQVAGIQQATDSLAAFNAEQTKQDDLTKSLISSIGTGLTGAFENLITGSQSALQAIGQFLVQLISKLIAAAAAAAVLAVILGAVGLGGGLSGAASSIGSFKNLFNGFSGITAFAEGGIISGPTLALMGEGKESEVVAPLSKFNAMVNERAGQGGKVAFEPFLIPNGMLIQAIQRGEQQKSRTS